MTEVRNDGQRKRVFIRTYGCQMNVYDSDRMADVLRTLGYVLADSPERADLVVLNTCHIREHASEKVYSELGRLRDAKNERRAEGREGTPETEDGATCGRARDLPADEGTRALAHREVQTTERLHSLRLAVDLQREALGKIDDIDLAHGSIFFWRPGPSDIRRLSSAESDQYSKVVLYCSLFIAAPL